MYLFKGQLFSVSENIDYSLKEMLGNALYPTECEISYIISQVGQIHTKRIVNPS